MSGLCGGFLGMLIDQPSCKLLKNKKYLSFQIPLKILFLRRSRNGGFLIN